MESKLESPTHYRCLICDVELTVSQIALHKRYTTHIANKKKLNEDLQAQGNHQPDNRYFLCPCGETFSALDMLSQMEHEKGERHRNFNQRGLGQPSVIPTEINKSISAPASIVSPPAQAENGTSSGANKKPKNRQARSQVSHVPTPQPTAIVPAAIQPSQPNKKEHPSQPRTTTAPAPEGSAPSPIDARSASSVPEAAKPAVPMYKCPQCNKLVPNAEKNILQHESGQRHREAVARLSNSAAPAVAQPSAQPTSAAPAQQQQQQQALPPRQRPKSKSQAGTSSAPPQASSSAPTVPTVAAVAPVAASTTTTATTAAPTNGTTGAPAAGSSTDAPPAADAAAQPPKKHKKKKKPAVPIVLGTLPEVPPARLREIAADVLQYHNDVRPYPKQFQQRGAFRKQFEDIVTQLWPGARVELFGSSATGIFFIDSDVDLCVIPPPALASQPDDQLMKELFKHLKNSFGKGLKLISHSRVPIIKRQYGPAREIMWDVCIGRELGVHNSKLLLEYCSLDERPYPLAFFINTWSKYVNINNSSQSQLSSYCLHLMLVFYLQNVTPPVLPCLQAGSLAPVPVGKYNCAFQQNLDFLSKNRQTVGEVLMGFLKYYAVEFDYDSSVVSIRCGKPIPKSSIGWEHFLFAVEDPFETDFNCGRPVKTVASLNKLKKEFFDAYVSACQHGAESLLPPEDRSSPPAPAPAPARATPAPAAAPAPAPAAQLPPQHPSPQQPRPPRQQQPPRAAQAPAGTAPVTSQPGQSVLPYAQGPSQPRAQQPQHTPQHAPQNPPQLQPAGADYQPRGKTRPQQAQPQQPPLQPQPQQAPPAAAYQSRPANQDASYRPPRMKRNPSQQQYNAVPPPASYSTHPQRQPAPVNPVTPVAAAAPQNPPQHPPPQHPRKPRQPPQQMQPVPTDQPAARHRYSAQTQLGQQPQQPLQHAPQHTHAPPQHTPQPAHVPASSGSAMTDAALPQRAPRVPRNNPRAADLPITTSRTVVDQTK